MVRNATAVWNGSGKEGKGNLTTQSTVLDKAQYSYNTRFENGVGTNPEELLAAAHAGCFTMALSFGLNKIGFTADSIETKAEITLDPAQGAITKSHLIVKASIPNITKEQFDEAVKGAEANCPVSKLFKAEITSDATLA
jgi:osmotically inducible protein OsmC